MCELVSISMYNKIMNKHLPIIFGRFLFLNLILLFINTMTIGVLNMGKCFFQTSQEQRPFQIYAWIEALEKNKLYLLKTIDILLRDVQTPNSIKILKNKVHSIF